MATPTSPGSISGAIASGSHYVDSLLVGTKWGGATGTGVALDYSFGGSGSVYASGYSESTSGFAEFSTVQKSAAANALAGWSEVANITFNEVTDSSTVAGDIRFAKSSMPSTAWAYYPASSTTAGDVWFGHSSWYETDTEGTYGYMTFLHELGHAIGLSHTHTSWSLGGAADLSIDTTRFSVMSYRSYEGAGLTGYTQAFYPTTPMLHDIAAVQFLYGADMTTRSGDTTYSWSTGQQLLETIWDGGGNDTIDWSNQSSAAQIDLNAGAWSQLGPAYWTGVGNESNTLAIAYGATIENATGGSGDDTIVGNSVANIIDGGAGADTLTGGLGNDTYIVDNVGDTVVEAAGEGTDTVNASLSYALGVNVENLTLTGGGNLTGTGNAGNNVLIGNSGANTLDGLGGNDALRGGGGNDQFFAGFLDGDDTLTGDGGFDTLDFSGVGGAIQVNQVAGTTTGSAGNDTLLDVFERVIGTDFNDVLSGGHGISSLIGGGGNDMFFGNRGDDLMRGGDGNDRFFFSWLDGDDRLEGGSGFDFLDYSGLGGAVQVNQLAGTTTGTAGNDILLDVFEQVIGTNFGDVLSGGHGINSLNGAGGNDQIFANGGNDWVTGGTGTDTITLGGGDDTFQFFDGDGNDTVTDFDALSAGEVINVTRFSLTNMSDFQSVTHSGVDVVVQVDADDSITLLGVNLADLDNTDFVF